MTEVIIAVVVTAAVASVLATVAIKGLDRLRKKDAETEAKSIVEQAERDAVNRIKEAELDIKDKAITQKAQAEQELGKLRDELRERERTLDRERDRVAEEFAAGRCLPGQVGDGIDRLDPRRGRHEDLR